MRYVHSIEINMPAHIVTALFADPKHIRDWQPSFIDLESLSGIPGHAGAKTRLRYRMGKGRRVVEMTETIEKNALPEMFTAIYEAKGVYNRVENRFSSLPDGRTLYTCDNEFRFTGIMKFIAWLFPASFKEQTGKTLRDFKQFVEKKGTPSL